jgi:hypothetical protein
MADEERSTPHERPDAEGHREPERHETPREEHKEKALQKGKVGQFVSDHKLAVASVVIGLIGLWLFIRHQSSSAASQAAQAGAPGAATPSDVTGGGGGYLSPGTLEPGTLPPGATGGQPGGTVNIFISNPPPTGGTPPPAPVPQPVPTVPQSHPVPGPSPKHEAKRKPSPKPTKTRIVVGHTHINVPPPEGFYNPFGSNTNPFAGRTGFYNPFGSGTNPLAGRPSPAANLTTGLSGAGRTHIAVTPQKASQKPKPRYEVGRTMVRP